MWRSTLVEDSDSDSVAQIAQVLYDALEVLVGFLPVFVEGAYCLASFVDSKTDC